MNNSMFKLTALALATSLSITLTGCSNDDDDNNAHTPVEATGQFVDSPVANLAVYQNGKKIATTNSEGKFTYMTGSDVTFKLGALTLGSTMPKAIVTPADLADDTDNVIEILQVLQSLDEDSNLENGIFIPQTTLEKLVTELDLSKDDVSIADTVKKDIPELNLVPKADAIDHFSQSQATIKKSDDLSKVADKFVGYWQQSCENGNQQIFQLAKDNMNPNMLKQIGQYVNRKYDNDDCTGTYNETIHYISGDPLTLKIMGTIHNEDGDLVVNALRTEGSSNFFDSLVMLNNNTYSSGALTFSYRDSLAFDDTPIDNKAEILKGYWKSECIESTNGSKFYYKNIQQVGNNLMFKESLREDFTSNNCSGTGVVSINEYSNGKTVSQSQLDSVELKGNNQFVSAGNTVENYNRITESDFPEITVNVNIDTPEKAVDTLVGYWKSDCINRSDNVVGAKSHVDIFNSIKQDSDTINSPVSLYQYYSGENCTGDVVFTRKEDDTELHTFSNPQQDVNGIWSFDVTNSDGARMAFPDANTITFSNDGETYRRSSKSEFESIESVAEENKTVPKVTNVDFTPATGGLQAKIVVTFNTDMSDNYYTTGSYSPSKSYWKDRRNFIVEFNSYIPGGTIKFAGYDQQGRKGFMNSSGIVMQNDYTFTFPN